MLGPSGKIVPEALEHFVVQRVGTVGCSCGWSWASGFLLFKGRGIICKLLGGGLLLRCFFGVRGRGAALVEALAMFAERSTCKVSHRFLKKKQKRWSAKKLEPKLLQTYISDANCPSREQVSSPVRGACA